MKMLVVLALSLVASASFAHGHRSVEGCRHGVRPTYRMTRDSFGKVAFVHSGWECRQAGHSIFGH